MPKDSNNGAELEVGSLTPEHLEWTGYQPSETQTLSSLSVPPACPILARSFPTTPGLGADDLVLSQSPLLAQEEAPKYLFQKVFI